MKRAMILSTVLLLVAGCDSVTSEPPQSGDTEATSAANITGFDNYVARLLPEGDLKADAEGFFDFDGNGGVFGSTSTGRAAKWTADARGNITGPVPLGTLPVPFDDAAQYVWSSNANGDVVGYAQPTPAGPKGTHATMLPSAPWVWAKGTMRLLPVPVDINRAASLAINDTSVVVGYVGSTLHGDHGAVWLPPHDALPVLLPRPEGYWFAAAGGISNAGIITGWAMGSRQGSHALVQWRIDAEGNVLSGPDILDTGASFAISAVNQNLDAAGHSGGRAHLFQSDRKQRIDLGLADGHSSSTAHGVNERAPDGAIQIVGWSSATSSYHARAMLWSVDVRGGVTGPVDLGLPDPHSKVAPAYQFTSARACSINNEGWVVGYSRRANGDQYATLWQPVAALPVADR